MDSWIAVEPPQSDQDVFITPYPLGPLTWIHPYPRPPPTGLCPGFALFRVPYKWNHAACGREPHVAYCSCDDSSLWCLDHTSCLLNADCLPTECTSPFVCSSTWWTSVVSIWKSCSECSPTSPCGYTFHFSRVERRRGRAAFACTCRSLVWGPCPPAEVVPPPHSPGTRLSLTMLWWARLYVLSGHPHLSWVKRVFWVCTDIWIRFCLTTLWDFFKICFWSKSLSDLFADVSAPCGFPLFILVS